MKRIRMLQTKNGSPDGIQVFQYQAAQVYLLPDELADVFLSEGWAEEEKSLEGMIEKKQVVEQKEDEEKIERKTKRRKG